MKCLIIFDHLNDIVYSKYNQIFVGHINNFATSQGFFKDTEVIRNDFIDDNIFVQLFSPIITSQRIMCCQFGNSYTSVECENGMNICFDEYMGYLFVGISFQDILDIKKFLSVSVTIARYLCGPNVCQLKDNAQKRTIASSLIESWTHLQNTDQAVFVEAVEQLVVNSEVSSATLQVLRKSVDNLITNTECSKIHAMILVKNKFLSLYSSQNAKELSASDILFSIMLSQSVTMPDISSDDTEDPEAKAMKYVLSEISDSDEKVDVKSFQLLLSGSDQNPSCLTHVIHVIPICEEINLLYLLEIGNVAVSLSLYETFCHLHAIQFIQIQRDVETLRPAFENLDLAIKRLSDALKKNKVVSVEYCSKQLFKKWDVIKKKYIDFIKNKTDESLLRAETLALGLLENLKLLLKVTSIDESILFSTQQQAAEAGAIVSAKLNTYNEFLKVKAFRNFTLGSDSLTINKYLEEFPGLVHFLYIDRGNHRVTAPTIDYTEDKLTKNKIWSMIKFARNHLQEGNLSLMWKDTIFNYAFFLWFEDSNGVPLKPIVFPKNSSKALPLPGLLGYDFYHQLKEVCFPKMSPSKIRCYELFCIHLGLVTASCVLEHTRRLAATIWELRGLSAHPIDLL